MRRREVLRRGGLLAALAACGYPFASRAGPTGDDAAFDARTSPDALRALGDVVIGDPRVVLRMADVVENGAVVPVSVECRLPRVSDIFVVVDSNPNPMAVQFTLAEGVDPQVSLRLKMADSGTVHAIVRADGRLYATARTAQVTVGGCG